MQWSWPCDVRQLCALLLLSGGCAPPWPAPSLAPKECPRAQPRVVLDLQAATRCGACPGTAARSGASPPLRSLPCDLCLDVAATASNRLEPRGHRDRCPGCSDEDL